MNNLQQTLSLLGWELRTEWRNRFGLGSIFLYVVATVVIVYFAARDLIEGGQEGGTLFNVFFWIILFFGAIVACGRSFLREGGRRHLYYYTIAAPEALLLSKIAFNSLLLFVLSGVAWGGLAFFSGRAAVVHPGYFVGAIALGCLGLSAILTFVSALAARAGGNGTLMAILSFPLVVPLLYLLVTAGNYATDTASVGRAAAPLMLAGAVDLVSLVVGLLLFPFVWRD